MHSARPCSADHLFCVRGIECQAEGACNGSLHHDYRQGSLGFVEMRMKRPACDHGSRDGKAGQSARAAAAAAASLLPHSFVEQSVDREFREGSSPRC
jgi:hypothetical protein